MSPTGRAEGSENSPTDSETVSTDSETSSTDSETLPTDSEASSTDSEASPTVAACQMAVKDLDVEANLDKITERVAGLPAETDVALFPEYALTGFVSDERIESAALGRDGPELARLCESASAADCALLVGFVEESGDSLYNAVAYIDPTGRSATGEDSADGDLPDEDHASAGETTIYRKRHLWAGERDVLESGSERVTVETPVGTTGLLTCYDLNFVGESASFAQSEVNALFVVGAWPALYSQNWKLLLRARALDGVRWVVGAGRTGQKAVGDSTEYAGRSRVIRPDGSVKAALDRSERDLVADLDPDVLAEYREFIPVHEHRKQ